MDALDRRCGRRMSRAEKVEYAKKKSEEQLKAELEDPGRVRILASKFEKERQRQIQQLKAARWQ